MSFKHEDDGAGPSQVCNVRYSEVSEGPTATPVTQTAEAFQQISYTDGAPPPVQQASSTPPVDVQKLPDNLRSTHTELARLLKRSTSKSRPKTAFTTYNFSKQSPEETVVKEIIISDRDVYETMSFHLKPRRPTFGQFGALPSSHRVISRLLEYR